MSTSDQDQIRYQESQARQEKEWEAQCLSCGMCCGVKDGDLCEELVLRDNGKYYCKVYESRLGPHRTISGKTFSCVLIRDILYKSWPGHDKCGYRQLPKDLFT